MLDASSHALFGAEHVAAASQHHQPRAGGAEYEAGLEAEAQLEAEEAAEDEEESDEEDEQ